MAFKKKKKPPFNKTERTAELRYPYVRNVRQEVCNKANIIGSNTVAVERKVSRD